VLRRPLGLVFTTEFLEKEYQDIHLAAYAPDFALVGCLMLTRLSETRVQMRQVAVAVAHQNVGIGSELVAFSERVAGRLGYQEMYLHARQEAIPFYLKNHYQIIGEPFEEIGIPHREMIKSLDL
jgi:predicted GNAT family N-acyltransferase